MSPASGDAAGASATATAAAASPFVQSSQAVPGSGKGIKIGYLSNDESVPIVHVISLGIEAQAKRAGVNLVFCNGAGRGYWSTAKAIKWRFRHSIGTLRGRPRVLGMMQYVHGSAHPV